VGGIEIQHSTTIPSVIAQRGIQMAIIAVPADRAQEVADVLVKANVRAILSYAPTVLQVPEGVWVRYIDPISVIHSMTFYLARD
jgi:redox-sensing transcriptional repressor